MDGNTSTRWSSVFQDNQWINIDLGADHHITQVVLNWEAAYATTYKVQVSEDPNFGTWTDLNTTTNGTGGINTLTVNGTGRYLRVLGQTRATPTASPSTRSRPTASNTTSLTASSPRSWRTP